MSPPVQKIPSDAQLPSRADVVVIGGGIIGVSAAYYLAKKGYSVAVVEKGHVAGEQSSRNWGWCRQQGRALPEIPLARHALNFWDDLSAESDTGFRRAGIAMVTKDPAEVESWRVWAEKAAEHQVHSRLLTPAEAAERTPGSGEKWAGGLVTENDGWAEPRKAAPAIAELARKLGVTIHQQCAARGLETSGGRVSGVVTEAGTIATDAVLCAGGAWTSMFLRHHGLDLQQAGVFATAWRTDAAVEVTKGGIGTPGAAIRRREDGGFTVGLSGRGRVELSMHGMRHALKFLPLFLMRRKSLTLRFGRTYAEAPDARLSWVDTEQSPFERVRVFDPAPDPKLVEKGMANLRETFPDLRAAQVAEMWGGFIDSSPDLLPVIGPIDRIPGLFIATCFSGHGFGVGPGAGHLAADLVAGSTPIVDAHPFRYSRMFDGSKLDPAGWN